MRTKALFVAAGALLMLAFGTGSVASASSVAAKSVKATAVIESHDADCGNDSGGASIGKAEYKRTGNNVSVKYKLTAGLPSTTYTVTLWQWTSNDSGCNSLELGSVGRVTTSKKGKGVRAGTVSIPATVDHIFATGTAAGFNNDSLAVILP